MVCVLCAVRMRMASANVCKRGSACMVNAHVQASEGRGSGYRAGRT
jgi:hypothetical protein